jgi:hypothetical protein
MIQITLTQTGDRKPLPKMSKRELYDAGRADWVLGRRADRERYALITYGGKVHMAIEIEELVTTKLREPEDTRDHRKAIEGKILKPGHEVYDTYVGKEMKGTRNPVHYFDSPFDLKACRCGCGTDVVRGDFLPGHDQRALRDRVAKVGTVAEFIDWFDKHYKD